MKFNENIPDQLRVLLEQQAADEKEELERVWTLADRAEAVSYGSNSSTIDVEHAVAQFERALLERKGQRRHERLAKPNRNRMLSRWKIAAVVCLFFVVGAWGFLAPIVKEAPVGEIASFNLPDGSHITLNSGSSISYRRIMLGRTRQVTLSGEGFFDVEPAVRPFIVKTANAEVQVLGTSFNVQAWPGETSYTALGVKEGTVEFTSLNTLDSVILSAGQMSRLYGLNGVPSQPAAFNSELSTLWKTGGFASIDRPLSELLRLLEYRFDIKIQVHDGVGLDDILTWIQPVLKRPQDALRDVCEIASCIYQNAGGLHQILPL